MKFGISLHIPDNWERHLAAGGAFGLKSKSRHRDMKFGISLHIPDNWEQPLPLVETGGLEPSTSRM